MRMEGLRDRTKQFALRIVRLYTSLPVTTLAQTLGKQVLRSGTSVAANFREASRARSSAEFISKLGIVEQELDETLLWLELLEEGGVFPKEKLVALRGEADELIRIVVASLRRSKTKKKRKAESGKSAFRFPTSAFPPLLRFPLSHFRFSASPPLSAFRPPLLTIPQPTILKESLHDKASQYRHDRLRLYGPGA